MNLKPTKTSFKEATKLKNIFNRIVEWNDIKIATVMWHDNRQWKIVDTMDFDKIKDREYQPIYQCHTQEELWEYIKSKLLIK